MDATDDERGEEFSIVKTDLLLDLSASAMVLGSAKILSQALRRVDGDFDYF